MAIQVFRQVYDPDDEAGGALPSRVVLEVPAPRRPVDASPWLEPDYSTVADQSELLGSGPFRDWPGPPMVMPAGLLPDGHPQGDDLIDASRRINGVPAQTTGEADEMIWAYMGQQQLLREELGLPPALLRPPDFEPADDDATLAAIAAIHSDRALRRRAS